MKRTFFAMLVATTALVPSAVMAQTTNETAPAQEATTQSQQQARPLTAASLNNQPIYDQAGQEFGRVTNFVRSQDNQIFAVVTSTDNRQLLVPVKLIAYDNGRLLMQGGGEQLAEYKEGSGNYQPVEQSQQIDIAAGQTGEASGSKIVVQQAAPS